MKKILKPAVLSVLLVVLASLGSGCAVNRATAKLVGDADLSNVKTLYVVKFAPDQRNLNEIMVDQLTKMGYTATTGSENSIPAGVDAVLTYRDKWMWDITNYMIELTITVSSPLQRSRSRS